MFKKLNQPMVYFVALSYVFFLGFFLLMGLSRALGLPEMVFNVVKIISAWSSTLAFIILLKRIYPGKKLTEFIKERFAQRISIPVVLTIIALQVVIVVSTLLMLPGSHLGFSLTVSGVGLIIYQFLGHLPLGPLGEQLGWRGYMQNELQNKYSPLKSALIKGSLWGFWHFPIWLVSGYTGMTLLLHSLFYMAALMSVAIIIAFFYRLNNNLLIPIIIHQLFNFFTSSIVADFYDVVMYTGIVYCLVAVMLIIVNPQGLLYMPRRKRPDSPVPL